MTKRQEVQSSQEARVGSGSEKTVDQLVKSQRVMGFKLKRLNQCAKCPWKVSTDPYDIPNGYCETRHAALSETIASPGGLNFGPVNVMACHESPVGEEAHCVGWLAHQLGPGNNIGLRLMMRDCENLSRLRLDGEQHEHFEDTLPDGF